MLVKKSIPLLSEEDYLELEKTSQQRHEYIDGYIYAMVGTSLLHNKIAMNLAALLHQQVKDTPCDVYMSDVKLKIESRHSYYYPDVMLACSRNEHNEYYITQPCLLVEVLSKSTAIIDKREKKVAYQSIPSLREYYLISQYNYRVERHYRLSETGLWHEIIYQQDDVFDCSCLAIEIAVNDIYAGVFKAKTQ
jgi:Uma2 family endonuclease